METTLVLFKADAVQRGLVGTILTRFEQRGLKIVGLVMVLATRKQAEDHYDEHRGTDFFDNIVAGLCESSPIVAVALAGPGAIALVRKMIGHRDPQQAEMGTIRGDMGLEMPFNLVHASGDSDAAERELVIWLPDQIDWIRTLDHWDHYRKITA